MRSVCEAFRYLSHLVSIRIFHGIFQGIFLKNSEFWYTLQYFKIFGRLFWKRLLESEIFSKYFMEYSWNIPGIFQPVQMWEVPQAPLTFELNSEYFRNILKKFWNFWYTLQNLKFFGRLFWKSLLESGIFSKYF